MFDSVTDWIVTIAVIAFIFYVLLPLDKAITELRLTKDSLESISNQIETRPQDPSTEKKDWETVITSILAIISLLATALIYLFKFTGKYASLVLILGAVITVSLVVLLRHIQTQKS